MLLLVASPHAAGHLSALSRGESWPPRGAAGFWGRVLGGAELPSQPEQAGRHRGPWRVRASCPHAAADAGVSVLPPPLLLGQTGSNAAWDVWLPGLCWPRRSLGLTLPSTHQCNQCHGLLPAEGWYTWRFLPLVQTETLMWEIWELLFLM